MAGALLFHQAKRLRDVADWLDRTAIAAGIADQEIRVAVDRQNISMWPDDLATAEALIGLLANPSRTFVAADTVLIAGTGPLGTVEVWVRKQWLTDESPVNDLVDAWLARRVDTMAQAVD